MMWNRLVGAFALASSLWIGSVIVQYLADPGIRDFVGLQLGFAMTVFVTLVALSE